MDKLFHGATAATVFVGKEWPRNHILQYAWNNVADTSDVLTTLPRLTSVMIERIPFTLIPLSPQTLYFNNGFQIQCKMDRVQHNKSRKMDLMGQYPEQLRQSGSAIP